MAKSRRDELFDKLDQVNINIKLANGRLREYEQKKDEFNAKHFRMMVNANQRTRKEIMDEIYKLDSNKSN